MSTAPELLAKSASHGGELSLLAHTQHVVAVAEAVAHATDMDERLARLGREVERVWATTSEAVYGLWW